MQGVYVYVTPFFPSPESWRGAYCYDFVWALRKVWDTQRVAVFVPGSGLDYEIMGVKVYRFPIKRLPSNILPFLFRVSNERSFLAKVDLVCKANGWNISDVVICHGNTAGCSIYPLAMKRINSRCKTLLHHHDLQSFGLNSGVFRHCWLYNMMMFPVLRRLHEKIDCHVFISKRSRDSFLHVPQTDWTDFEGYKRQMRLLPYRSPGIKSSVVLYNGVRMDIFNSKNRRRREEGPSVIGCIANFVALKDQMTLLRALLKIKRGGLLSLTPAVRFIGTGPCLARCKEYVTKNRLETLVSFEQEMGHAELPEFYRSIDLFVLPSYFEGFGCVFTEAWASGTPFIACEGQGISELIPESDRNLWLCKQRNPDDLADKIVHYFRAPQKQRLTQAVDVESLVGEFVKQVDAL